MTPVRSFAGWPMTPMLKRVMVVHGAVWLMEIISVQWLHVTWIVDHLALTPWSVFPGMEIWQPLTYMWLHSPGDLTHILFNMLFLWMFGGSLEQAWGSRAFISFYLKCGVGAGLIVLLSGWLIAPDMPVLGASGAIYGLVVAWGIFFPDKVVYFFGLFPIRGKYFAMIPIGYAVLTFLTRSHGVSHAAHLGGIAIGALLVTGYWRPRKARQRLKYWWLRRRLRVLEGERRSGPPDGGYWH